MSEYIIKNLFTDWLGNEYDEAVTTDDLDPWFKGYRSALKEVERKVESGELTAHIGEGISAETLENIGKRVAEIRAEAAEKEIAKLQSWLKNGEAKERHYDELREMFNAMESRAIAAEKERDKWKAEAEDKTLLFNAEYETALRYMRERDELRNRVEELEKIALEYQTLISIMNRAKKLAYQEIDNEENEHPRFKMDTNGHLTRVEDTL